MATWATAASAQPRSHFNSSRWPESKRAGFCGSGDWSAAHRCRLAPEDAREARDAAADQEACDSRSDQDLLAVARELRAPVGELRDLRLQVVQGVLQVLPRGLDGGPDLLRRTGCHQRRASSITARVFFASSIAI